MARRSQGLGTWPPRDPPCLHLGCPARAWPAAGNTPLLRERTCPVRSAGNTHGLQDGLVETGAQGKVPSWVTAALTTGQAPG